MRYGAQTLLGNELSGDAVNAVGLVLDAHQCSLQTLDELLLTGCHES